MNLARRTGQTCSSALAAQMQADVAAAAVAAALVTAAAVCGGSLVLHEGRRHRERPNLGAVHGAKYTVYAEVISGGRDLSRVLLRALRHWLPLSIARVRKRRLRSRRARCAARARAVQSACPVRAAGRRKHLCSRGRRDRVRRRTTRRRTCRTSRPQRSHLFDRDGCGTVAVPGRLPRLGDRTTLLDCYHHLGLQPAWEADDARTLLPDKEHLAALSLRRAPGIEPIQQRLSP